MCLLWVLYWYTISRKQQITGNGSLIVDILKFPRLCVICTYFFFCDIQHTNRKVMLASHFLFDSFEILYSVHFIFSGTIFQRARLFSISAPKSDVIVQEQCFTPRISYQQRRQSLPRRGFFGSNLAWLEFGSSDAAGSSNASAADFSTRLLSEETWRMLVECFWILFVVRL